MSDRPPLLLDTHAWIWAVEDDPRADSLKFYADTYVLPAIAIWEVSLLVAKGRLEVEPNIQTWVRRGLWTEIEVLPLNPEIAILANNLPGKFHADPADRIIVASAIHTGLALATADKRILEYAEAHNLEVQPLR